ncbi:MAG: Ada metal-binding domain-containing protein, partial [Telluria sp.]
MKAVMNTSSYSTEAQRWAALEQRDREADGIFYYGVRSTGVYCR